MPSEVTVADTVQTLREHAARTVYEPARMIAAQRQAAQALLHDTALPDALHTSTGLSVPMIRWALQTTLQGLLDAPLVELVAALPAPPAHGQLIAVVLAGNVFSAGLRALCLPLLAGAHVVAKAASAESTFVTAWHAALIAADSGSAERLAILQFSRDASAATRSLCQSADALSIYGDDHTVAQLTRLAKDSCRIIPHGHGISAAFVGREALASGETALEAARQLALDVAAYDQYGCLSPQFIGVAAGAAVSPRAFAELLADQALPELAARLPSAEPTLETTAARLQWQGAAAVRGELYAHPTHAVSFEDALPARPSPGGRLVAVHSCSDQTALQRLLQPFAAHLKLVGVAGSERTRSEVASLLATFSAAASCAAGTMQTPGFADWADGRPAFAGLLP